MYIIYIHTYLRVYIRTHIHLDIYISIFYMYIISSFPESDGLDCFGFAYTMCPP